MWIVFNVFPLIFSRITLFDISTQSIILSWDKSLGNWEILLSSRVSFHQKTIHVWPLFSCSLPKYKVTASQLITIFFFLHVHFQNTHTAHYQWDHEVPVNSKSVALQWLGRRNIKTFFCQQLLKRYPFPLITTIMENIFNPRKTLPQILYIDYISCNICTLKENIRRETERHSREMMER